MINKQIVNDYISVFQANSFFVNSITIKTSKAFYLIDTFLTPIDAKALKTHILDATNKIDFLISTHFHTDHCNGNKLFGDITLKSIAHKNYPQTVEDENKFFNYKSHIRSELLPPTMVLENEIMLNDEILLIPTPGHTFDSICIYHPDSKTLIAGDSILNNDPETYSFPYFAFGDCDLFIQSLERLQKLEIETIIPGHGEILNNKDKFQTDLKYLRLCSEFSKKNDEDLEKFANQTNFDFIELPIWRHDIHELNVKRIKEMRK